VNLPPPRDFFQTGFSRKNILSVYFLSCVDYWAHLHQIILSFVVWIDRSIISSGKSPPQWY